MTKLIFILTLALGAPNGWSFTLVAGVGYRLETASDGLLVSTFGPNPPNCWAYAGDGSMTWLFTPDSTGTNYQIISQAGNLALGCNSGDPAVHLQAPAAGNGQLWYLVERTNGYVAAYNKLNNNAMTVLNPFTTWYHAPHQSLTTTTYNSASNQLWWIAPVRLYPVQLIAVPPGYTCAAPKRMVLCASNNLGASVTGTLSNNVSSAVTNIIFNFGANLWNQYYYSNIDTSFATAAGAYTVTVSNFPPVSFVVNNNFYRATTNGAGGQCGIPDIVSGFFAYQREKDSATGWENYSNYWDNASNVVVTVDLGPANRDAHGGWNDATSNDKETFNESGALRNLAYAAEDAVNNSDRTNLLAEVTWGAQYLLRIQNSDGTFPCSLGPDGMNGGTAPGILVNVDCGIVAQAVTGLAAAARVLATNNPTLSSNCLAAAVLSWGWVSSHSTNVANYITNAALYQRSRGWVGAADNILGAAVELAITTGSPAYQSMATNLFYAGQFVTGSYSWADTSFWVKKSGAYPVQNSGYDAALSLARFYRQPQVYGQLKVDIATQLNICFANITRYINTPFGIDSGNFVNFGGESGALAIKGYLTLNFASGLANAGMMMTARDYMNWNYGANPFGSSFICGFGNLNVLSTFARPRSGSIGEIIPGPQVGPDGLLTTWNTNNLNSWAYGEGDISSTTLMPAYIALMDQQVATAAAGFTVIITNPVNQSIAVAGQPLSMKVSLINSSNAVKQVAFYQNGGLIGIATNAPFILTWSNSLPGSVELDAVATDSAGLTVPSAPVNITLANGSPMANPDTYTVFENTTNIFNPLTNDLVLAPGGSLSLVSVSATNGVASISGTNVVFTPSQYYIGTATIGYVVTDNVGDTNQGLITVNVISENTNLTLVVYTNSGTWNCPAGVSSVQVYCWGGGGGGGGSTLTAAGTAGGGGGGGGAFAAATVTVSSAGSPYAIVVGTGGSAGASGAAGRGWSGTASWFGTASITNVFAAGGAGGTNANGASGGGGMGGSGGSCTGIITFSGGNGSNGGGSGGGGGGSAGGGGNGGNGGITGGGTNGVAGNGMPGGVAGANGAGGAGSGASGTVPGGGGGGAKANTTTAGVGGVGGGGELVLIYTTPISTGTNIAFSREGSQLTLQWPGSYVGWSLQSNSIDLANSNDWFTVPGSAGTNQVIINLDPTNSGVFYRMVLPH